MQTFDVNHVISICITIFYILAEYLSPEQKRTFLDFYGNVARLKNLHKAAAARNEFNPVRCRLADGTVQTDPSLTCYGTDWPKFNPVRCRLTRV